MVTYELFILVSTFVSSSSSSSSQVNPEYDSTFVFENDFSALMREGPDPGLHLCVCVCVCVTITLSLPFSSPCVGDITRGAGAPIVALSISKRNMVSCRLCVSGCYT